MLDTPPPVSEPQMLIDGQFVDGVAGSFANINPATAKALEQVSNASKEDMDRAVNAARRALDETGWSADRTFRKRCLEGFIALGEVLTRWCGWENDYERGHTAHASSVRGWAALPARLG